jgi:hypothetical protein
MKGGVDELTPDSASGGKDSKQIRMIKKRNKKSNHRLRRLTQIISHEKALRLGSGQAQKHKGNHELTQIDTKGFWTLINYETGASNEVMIYGGRVLRP